MLPSLSASEFVRFVVASMVAHPDDVVVEETVDELGTLVTLRVNKEDMRTIIGRDGRTIQALRTLVRVYGSQSDRRVNLKIVE